MLMAPTTPCALMAAGFPYYVWYVLAMHVHGQFQCMPITMQMYSQMSGTSSPTDSSSRRYCDARYYATILFQSPCPSGIITMQKLSTRWGFSGLPGTYYLVMARAFRCFSIGRSRARMLAGMC